MGCSKSTSVIDGNLCAFKPEERLTKERKKERSARGREGVLMGAVADVMQVLDHASRLHTLFGLLASWFATFAVSIREKGEEAVMMIRRCSRAEGCLRVVRCSHWQPVDRACRTLYL